MKNKHTQMMKYVVAMLGLAIIAPLNGMAQTWSSQGNIFGGQNFFRNGQRAGHSMPNIFGGFDYYRGAGEDSFLFENGKFDQAFPEAIWLDAANARDVWQMTQLAWSLKGLEKVFGEVDEETTSEMMFDFAAQIALAQGNDEALKAIVSLSPATAKYNSEMAAVVTTRGKDAFVSGMPQIVLAPKTPKEFDKFVSKLKGYQVPSIAPSVLARNLPKTTAADVLNICTLINQGRFTKSPSMITLAALELAQNPDGMKIAFLKPSQMIEEAAELAILMDDKPALEFIVNMYDQETSPLADKAKSEMYSAEAAAMGKTRGKLLKNLINRMTLPSSSYFDFMTGIRDISEDIY